MRGGLDEAKKVNRVKIWGRRKIENLDNFKIDLNFSPISTCSSLFLMNFY